METKVQLILTALINAVEADFLRKPDFKGDGLYRFDRPLEVAFDKVLREVDGDEGITLPTLLRALLKDIEEAAELEIRARGGRRGDWSSPSIVAAWAQTKRAWMTPGFGEAYRYNALYGS